MPKNLTIFMDIGFDWGLLRQIEGLMMTRTMPLTLSLLLCNCHCYCEIAIAIWWLSLIFFYYIFIFYLTNFYCPFCHHKCEIVIV